MTLAQQKTLDERLEKQLSDQERAEQEVAEQEAKREAWGTSPQAQADQATLMAMAGAEG